ncbi:TMEM175 family protein [Chondrinema litorale]|uniref:TMEM175 family protein n=1 Tax=Chondrinema litorale TaxID=2994555 RepID=UPI0025428ACE|nr:TMEM175 family protein [Chondrinema litorale]UZR98532.1 TMEM175 family protein [Chondrinema litorale]
MESKNIEVERTVFFSDAVIAIAITLLALELKVETEDDQTLHFSDILDQWKSLVAFLLSFINIALFWKVHHTFFAHIIQIDNRLLFYNLIWLFFIVLIPFSTSLFGFHLFNFAAVVTYSINVLFVTIFQNLIWDYASNKKYYKKLDVIDELTYSELRLYCNLDIGNSVISIGLSFFSPALAFILLFTKLPILLVVVFFYQKKRRRKKHRKL